MSTRFHTAQCFWNAIARHKDANFFHPVFALMPFLSSCMGCYTRAYACACVYVASVNQVYVINVSQPQTKELNTSCRPHCTALVSSLSQQLSWSQRFFSFSSFSPRSEKNLWTQGNRSWLRNSKWRSGLSCSTIWLMYTKICEIH